MVEWIYIAFIIVSLLTVGMTLLTHEAQVVENQVMSSIFAQIRENTTNADIVNLIHSNCNTTPWYIFKSDCERSLLKTFITPTK
jgi:hypothetical protein